jgi:hypothetical protein
MGRSRPDAYPADLSVHGEKIFGHGRTVDGIFIDIEIDSKVIKKAAMKQPFFLVSKFD